MSMLHSWLHFRACPLIVKEEKWRKIVKIRKRGKSPNYSLVVFGHPVIRGFIPSQDNDYWWNIFYPWTIKIFTSWSRKYLIQFIVELLAEHWQCMKTWSWPWDHASLGHTIGWTCDKKYSYHFIHFTRVHSLRYIFVAQTFFELYWSCIKI